MNPKSIVSTLLACAVGLFAWHITHETPKPVFKTAPVEQGEIESIVTATGTTNPLVTVNVGTQVSGIITTLYVDFDSKVRKGDLLAEIDPRPFETSVEVAQSVVNSAQAALTAAQASVDVAEKGIEAARSDAERYKALAQEFASVEQRDKAVVDLNEKSGEIVSADSIAAAKAAYDQAADDTAGARAQQQTSELAIDEKRAESDVAAYNVDTAKAQLVQAQSGLQTAKVNLEHTRITSPIDGTVLLREVSVGETVAASAQVPVLFQIAQNLDKEEVDVNIDESDVSRVQVGQSATFDVDAFPGVTFQAKVRQVRKDATNIVNVITYDVVIDVVNPPVQLFPGMTANVHILSAAHNNVIKVPNAALRYRPMDSPKNAGAQASAKGTAVVYVLDSSGKPAIRKISPGISDGRYTEVVSGDLHPGDAVIVLETLVS